MLKLKRLQMSLKRLRSLRRLLRLLVLGSAILFIPFEARATPQAAFSLSVNPSSLTINPGASATATVTIARDAGFTDSVTFDAFEAVPAVVLPTGISITFNPASTTGNSVIATISVPGGVLAGVVNVTIAGTGGGLTRITSLAINVTGTTVAAVVTANGPFFNQE